MNTQHNKRIAKNALMLYIRMILMMCVSLYTSRVILNALGVEDFGIYNIVAGVVAMFSLLSGSLSTAISRFLTFEQGRGDIIHLKRVFSTSITIQIALGVVIALLIESIGVWFLNTKMVIPIERLSVANWVLQLSIVTFVINLLSVPYNALIISHEKMSAFAYIGIFEAIGKLTVSYLVNISPIDSLMFYAILICILSLCVRLVYMFYCKANFEECIYIHVYDKVLVRKMFSFAGWNFLGAGSALLMTQGINILINLFFGVTLNAARGIAVQVDNAITQFTNNFTIAVNPQITKSYAKGDLPYMHKLICAGSKYSFFLMLLISLPILFETRYILHLWLKLVPDYTIQFVRLTICISLLSVVSNTLVTSMLATGEIKKYQIIIGGLGMLVFPFSYLFYKFGFPPEYAYYINFTIFVFQLIIRLYLLKGMIELPVIMFLDKVILKDILVALSACALPLLLVLFLDVSFLRFLLTSIVCVFSTALAIFLFGLTIQEKKVFKAALIKIKNKNLNKQ